MLRNYGENKKKPEGFYPFGLSPPPRNISRHLQVQVLEYPDHIDPRYTPLKHADHIAVFIIEIRLRALARQRVYLHPSHICSIQLIHRTRSSSIQSSSWQDFPLPPHNNVPQSCRLPTTTTLPLDHSPPTHHQRYRNAIFVHPHHMNHFPTTRVSISLLR